MLRRAIGIGAVLFVFGALPPLITGASAAPYDDGQAAAVASRYDPASPQGWMTSQAGDRVYDVKHHGGTDQAVYAYAREDLDGWAAELGTPLRNGVFGENLTTEGVDVTGAVIGEHWRLGPDVVLEVCVPRIPCGTFQGWLARGGWIKQFTVAGRPGTHLRVIEPGLIRAGDPVVIEDRHRHDVTVSVTFRALTTEPELLPRLLAAGALPDGVRELARKRAAAQP